MKSAPRQEELSSDFILPISEIHVSGDRARDLDPAWAEALGRIMLTQGQTNAITVRLHASGEYHLVTGLHRLEGLRLHGDGTVRCRASNAENDDEATLEEVLENLGRAELNALDRCHHLFEFKRVWQKLHPEAAHGGDRKSDIKRQKLPLDPSNENTAEVFGLSRSIADAVGLSDRSIRLAVKIWTDLSVASRSKLAGTSLAHKQSELKLLSAQSASVQANVLALVLDPDAAPLDVQSALDFLLARVAMTPAERKFIAFSRQFVEMPDEDFDRLIVQAEDRVIASLQRRGRV